MTNKEQIFKLIESRIDTMQTLAIESIELIYNAGYNEGIEAAMNAIHDSNIYRYNKETLIVAIGELKK